MEICKRKSEFRKSKNVADFEEEEGDSSTSKGKEREMKILQVKIKKMKKEIENGGSSKD